MFKYKLYSRLGKAYNFVHSVFNGLQCLGTLHTYMINETLSSWLGLECEQIMTIIESYE